jgi:hypothetical protein
MMAAQGLKQAAFCEIGFDGEIIAHGALFPAPFGASEKFLVLRVKKQVFGPTHRIKNSQVLDDAGDGSSLAWFTGNAGRIGRMFSSSLLAFGV